MSDSSIVRQNVFQEEVKSFDSKDVSDMFDGPWNFFFFKSAKLVALQHTYLNGVTLNPRIQNFDYISNETEHFS